LKKRRKWILIAAVVLAVALAYGVFSFVTHSGSGAMTVSTAKSRAESLTGQRVKVEGRIAPGSVSWDAGAKVMKFGLTDNAARLDMVYNGVVPDSFRVGASVVVEGRFTVGGAFEALNFPTNTMCGICH